MQAAITSIAGVMSWLKKVLLLNHRMLGRPRIPDYANSVQAINFISRQLPLSFQSTLGMNPILNLAVSAVMLDNGKSVFLFNGNELLEVFLPFVLVHIPDKTDFL